MANPKLRLLCLLWALNSLSHAHAAVDLAPELKVIVPDVSIETRRMRGKDFEWEHDIQIALPQSYRKTDKAFPVLWVTDGLINFNLAAQVVNRLAKNHRLPQM